MNEKREFLAAIRSALGFSPYENRGVEHCPHLFAGQRDSEILERIRYRTHVEKQTLLKQLEENAELLGIHLETVASLEEAADTIVDVILKTTPEFSSARQVVQHDHEELSDLQLWKKLAGKPIQVHTSYPADREMREKTVESCIGLTVPDWVVAESATLIQLTRPGQPRSTSLVPSCHIALIRLKHIVANLTEAYALLDQASPDGSFTFITGPSKTADIEAHMVHGAHGPRELHLVVIDEHLQREENLKGSGLFSL